MSLDLITITEPRSPVSEAYRSLRTNLSFYSIDRPLKTLVVTSPTPDDGKSTTVANLAVTMAQSGRVTILVDCDLRRPQQHVHFGVSNSRGFTDIILENSSELPLQATEVENLYLISSGVLPPNPADILGTPQVDRLIAYLKEQADFVLFDAPPVLGVADATIIGAKVDGVLLVIKAGKTKRDHAEQAKEILDKANVNIVGATLTNAAKDRSIGGYYE